MDMVDEISIIRMLLYRYYTHVLYPMEHAVRRTGKFVLGTIAIVWLLAFLICMPPLAGWNDWPTEEKWTAGNMIYINTAPHYLRNL